MGMCAAWLGGLITHGQKSGNIPVVRASFSRQVSQAICPPKGTGRANNFKTHRDHPVTNSIPSYTVTLTKVLSIAMSGYHSNC